MLPSLRELWQMGTTFLLTVLAWVFFRADNLEVAIDIISNIFSPELIESPQIQNLGRWRTKFPPLILSLLILLSVEWFTRDRIYSSRLLFSNRILNIFIQLLMIVYIILFSSSYKGEFIYFQF